MGKAAIILLLSLVLITSVYSTSEDLYSISELNVSGDLNREVLTFTGEGSVLNGANVKIYLFGPRDDVLIDSLLVNGVNNALSFDSQGYYFVINDSFTFSGDLKLLSLGQIKLLIPGPVQKLNFDLINGYVIGGSSFYSQLNDYVIIQREEVDEVLVDADFHYVFDKENNFEYEINLNSLGDSLSSYTLNLLNGESVQSITGVLDYKISGNNLILELTGSTATVRITGKFDESDLRIPVIQGTHDVLIESEAEKRLSVSTTASVIDLSESTITPEYYNAQAFLASNEDVFYTTISDLTILSSLTFSISQANNKVAVSEKGTILGQLSYYYANSGEEYLELSVPGTPLYAATSQGAVMITKQENESEVFLSIPKTNYGNLDLTYLDTAQKLSLFNLFNVPLANSSMPISEMTTSVYLPKKYFVLWTFGAEFYEGTELPSIAGIIIVTSVIIGVGYFYKKNKLFVLKYFIILLGLLMLNPSLFYIGLALTGFLAVKNNVSKKKVKWLFIALIALIIISGLMVGLMNLFMIGMDYEYYSYSGSSVQADSNAPIMEGVEKVGEDEEGAISITTETGVLPVDFQIPRMGKTVTVTNNLVTLENPVSYRMLLVNSDLKYFIVLISAVLLLTEVKDFKKKK